MGQAGSAQLNGATRPEARSWSLARRLTALFLISTSLFVLAISATSAWFLRQSVDQEVESLVREELDEMKLVFSHGALGVERSALPEENEARAPSAEKVQALVDSFQSEHKECRFAWRFWPPSAAGRAGSAPRWTLGETGLLRPDTPGAERVDSGVEFEQGLLWRSESTETGWQIGLLVDARSHYEKLHAYLLYALGLILASLVLSFAIGRFFFLRVTRLLEQVARRAREVRRFEEPQSIDVPDAPVEIASIADALSEMLAKVRNETGQARVFTAGLAHELRSPVQNLIGETEVALLRERDNETYRRVLASNLEELRSLGDAIDNLVTICSAGDDGRSHRRERIDLGQESRIRLARERAQGARHGVQLELEVEGDTRLWGDREALLRAIRNLVANAVQWSPSGSEVRAHIRGSADAVEIVIEDAGPGVPVELRERIFEPFFRGPQAAGRRIGYGLGLALTRMAVSEHQGTIEVGESARGGARFRVRIPKHEPGLESDDDRTTRLTS